MFILVIVLLVLVAITKSGIDSTNGTAVNSSGLSSLSKDDERNADLDAIQLELVNYYSSNKKYPELNEINDPTWRSTNMPNLSDEHLKDPNGTESIMTDFPIKNKYAYFTYSESNQQCNNDPNVDCAEYLLSATLEDTDITISRDSLE